MNYLKVAVGSCNPAKIRAAERAFKKVFGDNIRIKPVKVDPGISIQPLSDEEMVLGAINRAKKAFEFIQPDYSVGMEGGLVKYSFGVFVKGWVAIFDGTKLSIASTISLPIPEFIWEKIASREIEELEKIMEELSGIKGIGETIGAIGFLTKNHYDRVRAFEDAIICALAKFIFRDLYE